ncbi:MAG TPA: DUF2505 family protein [Acidimicrobiales bacterium]|nr:DUF2505 family protein [Acidimicrobiales bacterium]
MRFDARHQFPAPPRDVAEVLADVGFHTGLDLPDLGPPQVVSATRQGDAAEIRLRYEFTGSLDPIARRLLGSHRLTWVQEVKVDLAATRGTLSFGAEADPGRLHGSARFVIEAEGAGSVRRIDGDLVVAVPGVGGMAERRIVPGLLRRIDIEADALRARLEGHG